MKMNNQIVVPMILLVFTFLLFAVRQRWIRHNVLDGWCSCGLCNLYGRSRIRRLVRRYVERLLTTTTKGE